MSSVTSATPWSATHLAALQAPTLAAASPQRQAVQQAALQRFLQLPWPTRSDEAWKYTSLHWLQTQAFESRAQRPHQPIDLPRLPIPSYRLVIVDGFWMPEWSDVAELPAGVKVVDWSAAESPDPVLLPEYTTPFTELNAALAQHGVVIELAANCQVDRPLHVVHVTTTTGTPVMTNVRHRLMAAPGSSLNLVEEYSGDEACYFTNVTWQVELHQAACLSWSKLQTEGQQAAHIASITVSQHRDSRLDYVTLSIGGKLSRDNLNIDLQAAGATCQLYGLYLPAGQQLIDHHTRIDHRVPHGTSVQHYKGIMAERGHGVFNGKVVVSPGAVQTNASQANHNLLLGTQAEIDTKPELEIYADDVKCSHGATVGQLDAAALFYLRSRGIKRAVAEQLLMQGFAQEILAHFSQTALANYFQAPLQRWLEAISCSR